MASNGEPHHPLQPEFEKFLPKRLAEELVRQYVRLKTRAWAGDHEGVQETGGKLAEHALRATQHLAGQTHVALRTEIRNMKQQCEALEKLPRSAADDALRVVLPRVVQTLYTLRNKRSGGHTASEVDPSRSDALLTERIADWIMAEFFRIGNELPLDQAEAAVAALVERRLPVVYEVGKFRRVLKTGLDPKAEIMVLLYAESTGATIGELRRWTRIPQTSLNRYIDQLERDRLVRVETQGRIRRVYLLPTGERRVEEQGWLQPE
jgi:DNA-binding transcriptional ArsR family regulator